MRLIARMRKKISYMRSETSSASQKIYIVSPFGVSVTNGERYIIHVEVDDEVCPWDEAVMSSGQRQPWRPGENMLA